MQPVVCSPQLPGLRPQHRPASLPPVVILLHVKPMPNVSLVEPLPPDSLAFTGHQPYSASPSNSVLQVTMWPEDPWQSDHLACPTSTAFHANILVANSSHQRVRSRMASNLPVKVSRLPQTTLAFFGLSHRQTMPSLCANKAKQKGGLRWLSGSLSSSKICLSLASPPLLSS